MAAGKYEADADLFEQTGPYEPITTRIRNILREYKDGVGIFKELIQNADDAGATTVKFLVDWRQGKTGSLFSPGMAECQGPALWAYNDAVFTEKDFDNINMLAGETKVKDLSKIGRFGLGFNAVYHLTDVPSFISREYLVVFDPNTHHLQHHIMDRSRPGIRVNLAKKPESLTRYHDQFQPYHGIFGCNTAQKSGSFLYNGTLFRFSLRTATQANTSAIIKTPYDRDKIQAIVCNLCECASTLLVFSQNVKMVEVYELDKSRQPSQMRLVLSVNKPSIQALRQKGVNNSESFIKQCSKWWEQYCESRQTCTEYPSCSEHVNIITTKKASELSRCDRDCSSNEIWFVVSASGSCASLTVACSQEGQLHGLLPCGGVASVVQKLPGHGSAESYVASDVFGELFCFLPLSISTGLPVHVNGYFAIMSNRVEMWKRTMMLDQPIEVIWNEALMEDALARAYIMLLEQMKELHLSGRVQHYEFHALWPSSEVVDMKSWEKLVQKVYNMLLDHQSKLFYSDGVWMSIDEGFLLSDDFHTIYGTAMEVLRPLGKRVFNLPRKILQTLVKFDKRSILKQRTLTFTAFMERYFFPNINKLSSTHRDAIVCFGLDRILNRNKSSYVSREREKVLFQQNPCITVSQSGENLREPCQLIHPFGPAAQLFCEEDNRFPVGNDLRDDNRLYVLKTLGMVDNLDWAGIHERAQSITKLDFHSGTERSRKLVEYLNKGINQLPADSDGYRNALRRVRFLPMLTEPIHDYLLPWKGSNCSSTTFCAPNDVFLPKISQLIGSSCYIVNTSDESGCGKLNADVEELLGFSGRLPKDRFVIQQLDAAIKFWDKLTEEEKQDTEKREAIESVCQKIYAFFSHRIVERATNESLLSELSKRKWLFLQDKFVQSKKVAFTSNGDGAPFLFTLPSKYGRDFRNLFEAMQIKQTFNQEDYIKALFELQNMKQGSVLTENELQIAILFVSQIDVKNTAVKDHIGNIPLPDTNRILCRSKDTVVNLSLWLKNPDDNLTVHEKIPLHTAYALGARSLKNVILEEYSDPIGDGESFGQHEDLTDRLKGILEGYPDDEILKELVQNADDAQASEIHFIYDTRCLGSEKVVTRKETSAEIQGPALCVYNDRPFSKEDLDGIRRLGIGSKRDILRTTGKYGTGFNSVYHLTDCPSFLSNDDTLVFLDPHCRYVSAAKSDAPGGRFSPIDEQFRRNFADSLDGYLENHFKLKGSTMFRFPLRREKNESKISKSTVNMEKRLKSFKEEAPKLLLFLHHIKNITLSKIGPNKKLEQIYQVEVHISSNDEKQRQEMARKICDLNTVPTEEIGWEELSYTLEIHEKKDRVEKWLIQQCVGCPIDGNRSEIPDGRELGLLPRGGLAARLWTHSSSTGKQSALRGMVYCFLPLPENYTNLPVHINGHFALDSTRRGLFTDTDGKEPRSRWNCFIKSCVLPPAYAALIKESQKYLCNDQADNQMSRYHALFPEVSTDSRWRILTIELYRYLGQTQAKILPMLTPTDECTGKKKDTFTCTRWLTADEASFVDSDKVDVLKLLIRIGLPVLLYTPLHVHSGFELANITSQIVTPTNVIAFLRGFNGPGKTCKIGELPKRLTTTPVKSIKELSALIEYCREDDDFGKHLEGLPLLLTHDCCLGVFQSSKPVFGSRFGKLFPTHASSFVHSEIVDLIASIVTESKENIVRDFTVSSLAVLLPHVFTEQKLKDVEDHATWKFPSEGPLSKNWFKQFWDFLQNHSKPMPDEDFVSLECLLDWPVIPTMCGKLVTIKNSKTVLDLTVTGTESTAQRSVRAFLKGLRCPVLDKEITYKNKSPHSRLAPSTQTKTKQRKKKHAKNFPQTNRMQEIVLERKAAVTDSYVAHPHNVIDVLTVLHHMQMTNRLNLSGRKEDEIQIRAFLQFAQDNYKPPERLEEYRQIIKRLPFHKALDGKFVSLDGQVSSYVLIPSGVPVQQLDELQHETKCLFLDSNALPAIQALYNDLGVTASQNPTQFYVKYVLKHFSMFSRESQIQHLIYIRDNVHLFFPRGGSTDKETLLNIMKEIPCIPDENGNLHRACEFYHSKNKIFKLIFENERGKFPPSPFEGEVWFDVLKDIGLHADITPELFLQFCAMVAEDGRRSPNEQKNVKRSIELVKCLFSEEALQEEEFLSQVSQIKFIAPVKLDKRFTSIHEQHQTPRNGDPPFIKFGNAVPLRFTNIAWTTASILPSWAEPNNTTKFKNLGIHYLGPTPAEVIVHLKNIVKAFRSKSVERNLLHKITKSIYRFLQELTECLSLDPGDRCSKVCVDIGSRLKDVSCIFLQKDEIFVKAEQLVFSLPDNFPLKPFLYPIPREFGDLEHFLKRLGACDRLKPMQLAFFLKVIYQEVGKEALSLDQEQKTKHAIYLLFTLLFNGEKADEIDELYLLSQSRRLVKSCNLIYNVSPRLSKVTDKLEYQILLPLEDCNLKNISDDYINALPVRLRPVKFEDLFREVIDPACKDSICPEAQQSSICDFQQQFESLLRSDEFQEGLERLLICNGKDAQKFEHRIKKLQTDVQTKCTGFGCVRINIIYRDTSAVLDDLENSSYVVEEEGRWSLYMQHGCNDVRGLVFIASCINKILGDCIQKESGLIMMLGCSSPSQISGILDTLNIPYKPSKSANDFTPPDGDIFSGWESGSDSRTRRDDWIGELDEYEGTGGTRADNGGGHWYNPAGAASFNDGGHGISFRGGGGPGGGGQLRTGYKSDTFFPADYNYAMSMLQESKSHLGGARWLLQSVPPFIALACLHSLKVVEKCLKALLFASCDISKTLSDFHSVKQLLHEVRQVKKVPNKICSLAVRVAKYYKSPFDVDNQQEAEMAVDAARKVFEFTENCLTEEQHCVSPLAWH